MPTAGDKKTNSISGLPEIFDGTLNAWIDDESAGAVDKATVTDIDAGTSDKFVDAKGLKETLDTHNITGNYIGSSNKFAGLPKKNTNGKNAVNGDWAILTAKDGVNPKGVYIFDGSIYSFVVELAADVTIKEVENTWKNSLNTDYSTKGLVSYEQIVNVSREQAIHVDDYATANVTDVEAGQYIIVGKGDNYAGLWRNHTNATQTFLATSTNFTRLSGSQNTYGYDDLATPNGVSFPSGAILHIVGSGTYRNIATTAQTFAGVEDANYKLIGAQAQADTKLVRETLIATANTFAMTAGKFSWLAATGITANPTVTLPDLSAYDADNPIWGKITNTSGRTATLAANGNTLVTDSLDTLGDRRIAHYYQTGPSTVLIYDDGGLTGAQSTYTGLQRIGTQFRGAEIEINNSRIVTGLDLTRATGRLVMQFTDTGETGRPWPLAQIDLEEIRENNAFFVWNHSGGYLIGTINDLATGDITFADVTRSARLIFAEVVDFAENGFVIPTGKDLVTDRTLVVTSPTTTPGITIIEEQASRYTVNVTAGKKLVLGAVTDANITLLSADDGLILAQATGANPSVTFTEEDSTAFVQVTGAALQNATWTDVVAGLQLHQGTNADDRPYIRFPTGSAAGGDRSIRMDRWYSTTVGGAWAGRANANQILSPNEVYDIAGSGGYNLGANYEQYIVIEDIVTLERWSIKYTMDASDNDAVMDYTYTPSPLP